ncbi:MAG: hypothetical protein MJZ37_00970 [Bacilli bacterium]|nr:hypothetical protein [Bacilli bacterium]
MFYDFDCTNCNQTVEIEKGMNNPAPDKCPKCGAVGTLERNWGNNKPIATVYKCKGMYDTDSRKVGSR